MEISFRQRREDEAPIVWVITPFQLQSLLVECQRNVVNGDDAAWREVILAVVVEYVRTCCPHIVPSPHIQHLALLCQVSLNEHFGRVYEQAHRGSRVDELANVLRRRIDLLREPITFFLVVELHGERLWSRACLRVNNLKCMLQARKTGRKAIEHNALQWHEIHHL